MPRLVNRESHVKRTAPAATDKRLSSWEHGPYSAADHPGHVRSGRSVVPRQPVTVVTSSWVCLKIGDSGSVRSAQPSSKRKGKSHGDILSY